MFSRKSRILSTLLIVIFVQFNYALPVYPYSLLRQQATSSTITAKRNLENVITEGDNDLGSLHWFEVFPQNEEPEYEFIPRQNFTFSSARRYDYNNAQDRIDIENMLKERNWYYRFYSAEEKKMFIHNIFDSLSEGMVSELKRMVVGALEEQGHYITVEDIASVLAYGSWCYLSDEPSDIDIAIVIKGDISNNDNDNAFIVKPGWFKDKQRSVDWCCDIYLMGTKQLLAPVDRKEQSTVNFEVSMRGHGILLDGVDFFSSPSGTHNLLCKAEQLFSLVLLYSTKGVRQKVIDITGKASYVTIKKSTILEKIYKRIKEAENILRFISLKQPGQIKGNDQNIAEVLAELSKAKQAIGYMRLVKNIRSHEKAESIISSALESEVSPHIRKAIEEIRIMKNQPVMPVQPEASSAGLSARDKLTGPFRNNPEKVFPASTKLIKPKTIINTITSAA